MKALAGAARSRRALGARMVLSRFSDADVFRRLIGAGSAPHGVLWQVCMSSSIG